MAFQGDQKRQTHCPPQNTQQPWDIGGRGDNRKRQLNADNMSSGEMAAYATDAASDGGTMTSWASIHFSDAAGAEVYERGYHPDHKAPTTQSTNTADTGATDCTIRDSLDGRRKGGVFVAMTGDGQAVHPAHTATAPEPIRPALTKQHLEQHDTNNDEVRKWLEKSRPRYARPNMKSLRKESSLWSLRSEATSDDLSLSPPPDNDMARDLMEIGARFRH